MRADVVATRYEGLLGDDGDVVEEGVPRDAAEVHAWNREEFGRHVGYLPQETSIFRKLTVKQNLMAILEILPIDSAEREERAEMLLEELGIKHLQKQKKWPVVVKQKDPRNNPLKKQRQKNTKKTWRFEMNP